MERSNPPAGSTFFTPFAEGDLVDRKMLLP
jgi:hypothetical protein